MILLTYGRYELELKGKNPLGLSLIYFKTQITCMQFSQTYKCCFYRKVYHSGVERAIQFTSKNETEEAKAKNRAIFRFSSVEAARYFAQIEI